MLVVVGVELMVVVVVVMRMVRLMSDEAAVMVNNGNGDHGDVGLFTGCSSMDLLVLVCSLYERITFRFLVTCTLLLIS